MSGSVSTGDVLDRDINETPHNQYTKAYIEILNAYKEQFSTSVEKKNQLKDNFFKLIHHIMYAMVITFCIVIILSVILMIIMAYRKSSSAEMISGAIISIISSFVTVIVAIYKLPEIIAKYLFNKDEDKYMKEIIENIQRYELDADRSEKLRSQADVDATLNSLSNADADSEMGDLAYVDSSINPKGVVKA